MRTKELRELAAKADELGLSMISNWLTVAIRLKHYCEWQLGLSLVLFLAGFIFFFITLVLR